MVIDCCLVVIVLYIVVCICYAICKSKESEETKLIKKVVNFIVDAVFCPIQYIVKVFKKKIVEPAPEPVAAKKPRKKRRKK